MRIRSKLVAPLAATAVLVLSGTGGNAGASTQMTRYVVVLAGTATSDGFTLAGTQAAVGALVTTVGGMVTRDLSKQIGVLVVESPNALFDETLRQSPLVTAAAEDFKWKAFPSTQEAVASGYLTEVSPSSVPGGGPSPHADALEPFQWSMQQIRAPLAHATQAGSPLVEVGILDSGVDAAHVDLSAKVDCVKTRDFVPLGPGIAVGGPCNDNQFHGTHVAGIVAGAINGVGIVGVAPKVKARPGEGLRRARVLLFELDGRGDQVRRRREARGHQHELLRRRRPVPPLHRVQVLDRPGAAGVPAGERPRPPARAVRKQLRRGSGRDAGRDR